MKKRKEYSSGSVRKNQASGRSIIIAVFISSLLLSLVCSLFYNLWFYEVANLKAQEGDWQVRIAGEISPQALERIENHASVEKVLIHDSPSDEQQAVTDVYFFHLNDVLKDMPGIAELAGLDPESISYHYSLLNLYLIRSGDDTALRWVFPFFVLVTAAACLALILVIHNAFAVTMNAKVHQLGILSGVGATPRQIWLSLMQEALGLCLVPVALGNLLGIPLSAGVIEGINLALADIPGRLSLPFQYQPWIFLLSFLVSLVTVIISAAIPAVRLGRITPMEAIRTAEDLQLKKKRNSGILSFLFGVEGELAGNSMKVQRKSMRTAALSLTLSFLAFSFMLSFLTLQKVNQNMTYFERYQGTWDIMVTMDGKNIADFTEAGSLEKLNGVRDSVTYQKARALRLVTPDEVTAELKEAGGLENISSSLEASGDGWLAEAPLIILDDASFLEYCAQLGIKPSLDGAVILNQARDASDPNFHDRRTIPYLTGSNPFTTLRNASQENLSAELPVLAYTSQVPLLREEYGTADFYELVHFIPLSVWEEIEGKIEGEESGTIIRILGRNGLTLEEAQKIEEEAAGLLGQDYPFKMENRIQEKIDNDNMFSGMAFVIGLFCTLLAMIGIGSIFASTLGFVQQRKREFARYMSVGMTPGQLRKIFLVEALVTIGRPVLAAVLVTAVSVVFFLNMAYLDPADFLREAPVFPVIGFILAVSGLVALAYYLGAKKVLSSSLSDILRDDSIL